MKVRKLLPVVLHEDEDLMVIAKPSGMLCIPDRYDAEKPHLLSEMPSTFGKLWVVHRLDLETSGVIIFGRNAEAHKALNDQFASRTVHKTYHALVCGLISWETLHVDLPLKVSADAKFRTIVDRSQGKSASTDFSVLEKFKSFTLVQCVPATGRTHQIRVHLAAIGFPIVKDDLYGDGQPLLLSRHKHAYRGDTETERPLLPRLGLHSHELEILHPRTCEKCTFKAPYPKDLTATLNQLRKL